jgi:WD40 repeat protein
MKVPDTAAGKLVKCPNCETRTKVPFPVAERIEEEEEAPRPKKKPARQEIDDEELPRKKPRRPRDEDDEVDEEETPRRKKAIAKSGNNKVLFLVLAAVGGLVLLGGGVGAAWYFMKGSKVAKQSEDFALVAKDLQTINPRKQFTAEIPKSDTGSTVNVSKLALNQDGSRLIISMGANEQIQIWDIQNEPNKLASAKGSTSGFSSDGLLISGYFGVGNNLIETESGKPSSAKFIGTSTTDLRGTLRSDKVNFWWERSTDWRNPAAFVIRESESDKSTARFNHNAGDDDRVVLATPVNQDKELMFGVPAQNKIRVFNFTSKSITREFELDKPRPYSSVGKVPSWDGFAVHPEGKWIAVRRRFGSVDPLEFFDSNGKFSSQLGEKKFHEASGIFLPGRDLYVAGVYPIAGAKTAEAYDLVRKEIVASFSGHTSSVWCIAVSGNGKIMATASLNGEICIFDLTQIK